MSDLYTNLMDYWTLQEASGNRAGSQGVLTLTDNNTVPGAAGKVGNGAQFTLANSESLSSASVVSLQMGSGQDFTLATWVKLATKATDQALIVKATDVSGAAGIEYVLQYKLANDRFNALVSNGSATANQLADTLGAVSVDTWYFVVAWLDAGTSLNIQVNNGTADTLGTAVYAQAAAGGFALGRNGGDVTIPHYLNGMLDEAAIWKRILTAAERTFLYNAGAGRTWPLRAPAQQALIV